MKFQALRLWAACSVSVIQIVFSCLVLWTTPVYSQTPDTEPPEVGLDSVVESQKGDSQVFTITATDDSEITDLTIFYRMGQSGEFQSAQMSQIGNTDLYTYTLAAEAVAPSADVIQYYFDARDAAGNRTLQGFSFDPLERALIAPSSTVADSGPTSNAQTNDTSTGISSLSTTQKVVYGALALLIVGALVSAASDSGGDSGGSSNNPGNETTPVTITGEPLVSGL